MEQNEIDSFKFSMDLWVKDINSKLMELSAYPQVFQQNIDNIEHNYELLKQMREENEELKKQIQVMKVTQLLIIKKLFREDFENLAKNPEMLASIQGAAGIKTNAPEFSGIRQRSRREVKA
jgi:hypothetical protein